MPAKSKAQQALFAMAEHMPASKLSGSARKLKSTLSKRKLHEFAATKTKGLPQHLASGLKK